jgi:hypothetical protein
MLLAHPQSTAIDLPLIEGLICALAATFGVDLGMRHARRGGADAAAARMRCDRAEPAFGSYAGSGGSNNKS